MMEQLKRGAQSLGLNLTAHQLDQFQVLYQELVEWNKKFNLTAITEYEQVQIRHLTDSLSCLVALQKGSAGKADAPLQAIDVGSGAGFPGLPIKIYCSRMHMVLLEATAKKVRFIEHIVDRLGLEGAEPLWGRAEEVAHDAAHREGYDLVLARAVAELPVLAEYLLPFCRIGGQVIAQKGARAQEETQAAAYALSLLGGQLRQVIPIELQGLAETRHLVVIDKVARTPARYPRRTGIPAKRPLRGELGNSATGD
jgi:16S rRNA (guanine527-N7)-methyltransferase